MLEGLEANEVNYSNLERTLRIDSEFYKTDNINVLDVVNTKKPKPLTHYVKVSDGNHMSISEHFCEEGIPYYRGSDIYNFYIEQTEKPLFIPESIYQNRYMLRSHLKKGDVLISIVGAIIGNLSIVKTDSKATCSCKLAILRPKNVSPELLSIFLKSRYGQNQIQKFRRGTGQTGFILEDFDQLLMPVFTKCFSDSIKTLVDKSFSNIITSNNLYKEAENLLLKEIELLEFYENPSNVNIKLLSKSFNTTGRLDSEYYQQKYEEVLKKITLREHHTLNELVYISKSMEPGSANYSDDGLPFLRVSDFTKYGLTKPQKFLKTSFTTENREKIKKLRPRKGTILFSKDGSVGTAYHLRHDYEGITSSAILHLKVKNEAQVIPEYLTLALNSKIVQMQAERDAGGSIILHWRVKEIENVIVPLIGIEKQKEIAKMVEESFILKKQSEHLLECAKKAVEIAIEQSEEIAISFIEENK